MKELAEWLISMEEQAFLLYSKAVEFFGHDVQLASLLEQLSEDEAWHFHIMGSAANFLGNRQDYPSFLAVDTATQIKLSAPLVKALASLEAKTLSQEQLIDCILETEYSEWNQVFLYVVNTLKGKSKEFKCTAATVQQHIQHIKHAFASMPYARKRLEELTIIPPLWEESILIVEDDDSIRNLLQAVLKRSGRLETAKNGEEALAKIKKNFYKVIVSDIDMPKKDGLEFFKNAEGLFPNIGARFLFFTGSLPPDRLAFLTKNNIAYLEKPAPISSIINSVTEILLKRKTCKCT